MRRTTLEKLLQELIERHSTPDSTPAPVAAPVMYANNAVPLHRTLNVAVAVLGALVGVGAVLAVHYVIQPPREGVVVTAGAPAQAEYAMLVANTGGLGVCLRAEPNEQSKLARPCYIDGKQVTITGDEVNGYLPISQPDKGWLPKSLLFPKPRIIPIIRIPTPIRSSTPAIIPNPTPNYTSTASAQAGAIAVPDLKLSIPSYTQVYRNGEKLPFEITLTGAHGAYKERQPYNNYEILVMLFQTCCTGPQIFLNSDSAGRITGDIPLRNLSPGTYYLEAHPSTFKTKTYEGFRRAPNSSAEAEKYTPLSTKRIELKIEN